LQVLLAFCFLACIFFGSCDFIAFHRWNVWLLPRQGTVTAVAADENHRDRMQFGMAFLMGCIVLTAWIATMWQQALSSDAIAYRSFRNYANEGTPFILLLFSFFWLLHVSLLCATLQSAVRSGVIASIVLVLVGTEGIRQVQQWKNGIPLDYLNWEFSMIVAGFVIAHSVIGATIRWLGWELRFCKAIG
jgi:hypothetical protein